MKYVLVSYFNSNNLGDVLLSNTIYKELKKYTEIVTCSFEGDFVEPEDILYEKKWKKRILNKLFGKIKERCFWKRFEREIAASDGLIIGGGNMLMDIATYSTIQTFSKYVNLARKYNKKVIVPFVGIGPIEDEKLLVDVEKGLNKCNYISVRDSKALAYIDEKVVHCSYDPAFLLKERDVKKEKAIIINVINPKVFSDVSDNIVRFYLRLIEAVLKIITEYKVILLVTEKRDKETAEYIVDNLKNKDKVEISCPRSTEEFVTIVSSVRFVVAARMHLMIVSYTQGIPFVGLNWQHKIQGFFENIEMLERCFEFSCEIIDEIVETIRISDDTVFRNIIEKRRNYIQNDIKQNFKIIGEIINET